MKILTLTRLIFIYCLGSCYPILCQNVHGIDVSNWQGTIDWNEVSNDGQVYAWAKASEGMTYQDPQFDNNMTNGLNAGVVMGAYHFARPDNNLASEDASNFLSTAGAYIGSGFLPPVLDLENPYSGGQAIVLSNIFTSNELSNWALEWMTIIETQTGITPIIYVNGNYANYLNSSVNTFGLWFAQPDELLTPPVNIGDWNDWQFKQYSWWGEIPGIIGDVDLNIFNGSIVEFNELIGISTAQTSSISGRFDISYYPNPVVEQIHIKGLPADVEQVFVSNINGQIQLSAQLIDHSLDVSQLIPGLYFINIKLKTGHVFLARFIKL